MASFTNESTTLVEFVTKVEWLTSFQTEDLVTSLAPSDIEVVPYFHRLVMAVGCGLVTLIGVLGNGLVVVSVLISQKLRTTTNILVVNLAVADFLTCAILPFLTIGLVDRSGMYPLPEIICGVAAGMLSVCVAVSISTLAAIAFLRWYVITRSIRGHRGLHTPRRIVYLVIIIWALSTGLVVIPLLLGIGAVGYSTYYSLCSVTDTNPLRFYFVVLQSVFIFINLVLIWIFYALILSHVLRQTRQFCKMLKDNAPGGSALRTEPIKQTNANIILNSREVEITKNLFLVVCVFVLCWLPNCINFSIPGTSVLTLYGALISFANSAVNPIIYGLRHPNFREVFERILLRRAA